MWPPPVSDQGERETLLLRYWAGPSGGSRGKAAAAHCAGSEEQAIGPGCRLPGKKVSYSFFSSFFSLFAYLPNYSK
jgi:hypothetical protein